MTDPLLAFAATCLGLIVGSFINALSFRFNTGVSIVHGRSKCMRCGHTLSALDLVPVLSYMWLRGRCRYCGTKISFQYPLVELLAALLVFGTYVNAGTLPMFALWSLVWMVILFIVVYDMRHTIIPWSCLLLLMGLSLALIWMSGAPLVPALLAGPILALPFVLISFVSRGTWMGWGDGFFELSLGWLLGLIPGFTALLLGIWSGALIGVALIMWAQLPSKHKGGFTMKSELPFAPFLALGAALVYFFHVSLFVYGF